MWSELNLFDFVFIFVLRFCRAAQVLPLAAATSKQLGQLLVATNSREGGKF